MLANSGDPDQTPQYAASDLALHCFHMSDKKDVRLIWVNRVLIQFNSEDPDQTTELGGHCLHIVP